MTAKPAPVSLGRPLCRCGQCWTGMLKIDPQATLFAMVRLGEEAGRAEIEHKALLEWLKGACPAA